MTNTTRGTMGALRTPRAVLHLACLALLVMGAVRGQEVCRPGMPCWQGGYSQPSYQQPAYTQPRSGGVPQVRYVPKRVGPSADAGVQWSPNASDVVVYSEEAGGMVSYRGSGVVISKGTTARGIITAAHNLRGTVATWVLYRTGKYRAQVLAIDEQADLAVILVQNAPELQAVPVAQSPAAGAVEIRSYDGGRQFMHRRGSVTATQWVGDRFGVSCNIQQGSSGGGVFANGSLCGIVVCDDPGREAYCIGLQSIRAIIAKAGITVGPCTPATDPPQPTDPGPATTSSAPRINCRCSESCTCRKSFDEAKAEALAAIDKMEASLNARIDARIEAKSPFPTATILESIKAHEERIAHLEEKVDLALVQSGTPGPQGPQGPAGKDGKDATLDPALQNRISQLEAELVALKDRKIRLELHKDGELIGVSEGTHTVRVNINELEK